MRLYVLAFAALAGGAQADISEVVEIHGCAVVPELSNFMQCRITNHAEVAIAEVRYDHLYTEDGRTVPWADTRGSQTPHGYLAIAGGVEPGETVEHLVRLYGIPARADRDRIKFRFIPVSATDHTGRVIK